MVKCNKHPKYKGVKRPINNCIECLNFWSSFGANKTRETLPPNKVFKDKSKYSRKDKHRIDDETS